MAETATCNETIDAMSPLRGGEKGEKYYLRGVAVLSFGFVGVFGGFQAAQGLQTSLNAELGFINLAALDCFSSM